VLAIALAGVSAPASAQPSAVVWPNMPAPQDYKPPAKRVSPGTGFAQVTSTAPTPLRADGKPDLSGVWGGTPPSPAGPGGLRRLGTFETDQITLQRAAGWNKPIYKPEFWQMVRDNDYSIADLDPGYNCAEPGVPRQNAPDKIIHLDNEVVLFNWPIARIIPIGREREPTDMDQTTSMGVGIGRWDGDTLVVESVGFNNVTWLQFQGYFHTDLMTVTERFRRQGNLLYYNFTVDDPDVLMEPWTQDTMVKILNTNPNVRFLEPQPCEPTGIPEDDPYNRG
jgi:hypothetical protein